MRHLYLPDSDSRAKSAHVKTLTAVIFGLCPLCYGDLIAEFETDKGTIEVELQYDTAPQAVANLITMAEGTRSRIDYNTGEITNDPLYVGEKFYRTANNDFSKFAQTGSGTDSNVGSTGFTFKDEFDPGTRHTGYTLSMANSGPNTNGGQIFFTGNINIPTYDDRHTIVGLITSAASRTVIDNIIAAGDNNSHIISVSFLRTDASALAFDEHAQSLPTVMKPAGNLLVVPGQFCRYNLLPAATTGDVVGAYRSTDLGTWTQETRQHVGISTGALLTPALVSLDIDDASLPSAFYNVSIANHPGAVAPSHFSSRTLTLPLDGGVYTFAFDNTGLGGTVTFTPDSGTPFGGPFSIHNQDIFTSAHGFSMITDSPLINPRYLRITAGADSATNSLVTCHHITAYWSALNWVEYPKGSCTVTR